MNPQFHKFRIEKKIQEIEDAVTLCFSVPKELEQTFKYKSGQHLTVRVFINGSEQRRNYSFSSHPAFDEYMTITVKKAVNGYVSKHINEQINENDEIELYPPSGSFTIDLNESNNRHFVMFAGGSGITPIISITKDVLQNEPLSRITLVYANSNEKTIIFQAQLARLAENYSNRLELIHVLNSPSADWEKFKGTITPEFVKEIAEKSISLNQANSTEFFMCGPGGLMDVVQNTLLDLGVPAQNVHRENFIASQKSLPKPTDNQASGEVRIKIYAEEKSLVVEKDETILQAAIAAKLDPPYSCQMGVCGTCKAKLLSGEVKMDECDALTDKEIKEGWVLTCQAHPVSGNVFLDYDAN